MAQAVGRWLSIAGRRHPVDPDRDRKPPDEGGKEVGGLTDNRGIPGEAGHPGEVHPAQVQRRRVGHADVIDGLPCRQPLVKHPLEQGHVHRPRVEQEGMFVVQRPEGIGKPTHKRALAQRLEDDPGIVGELSSQFSRQLGGADAFLVQEIGGGDRKLAEEEGAG